MGSEVWPSSLRISPDDFEAAPFYANTAQVARDLSELRLQHGEGWRGTFTVRTVGTTERNTLVQFFAARKGGWDSFFFTSPDDSVSRLVKFEADALVGRKLGPTTWEYRISLVTVGA